MTGSDKERAGPPPPHSDHKGLVPIEFRFPCVPLLYSAVSGWGA